MAIQDDFFLTNLELRESNAVGEEAAGLSHASMKGMFLLTVLELAARGVPKGAVTVLHDAGDTGERYKALAAALAAAGFAVALPDLRGHGRSEGPRGHSNGLREVERDVQEIQDHLAYRMPDDPKVLVGVGLGANYAAHFAAAKPGALAGLVLVSPLFTPRFERPAPPTGLKKLLGKKAQPTDEGHVPWRASQLTTNAAEATAFEAHPLTHATITLRAIDEAERSAREALPKLGSLGVPTLVLCGGDDELSDADRATALARGEVETKVYPGLRHALLRQGSCATSSRGSNASRRGDPTLGRVGAGCASDSDDPPNERFAVQRRSGCGTRPSLPGGLFTRPVGFDVDGTRLACWLGCPPRSGRASLSSSSSSRARRPPAPTAVVATAARVRPAWSCPTGPLSGNRPLVRRRQLRGPRSRSLPCL